MSLSICTVTSAQTLTLGGCQEFEIDASGGSFDVTLPTAVGYDGTHIYIKRQDTTGTSTVHILCQTGQTLDGRTSTTLTTLAVRHVMANNGQWVIIGN